MNMFERAMEEIRGNVSSSLDKTIDSGPMSPFQKFKTEVSSEEAYTLLEWNDKLPTKFHLHGLSHENLIALLALSKMMPQGPVYIGIDWASNIITGVQAGNIVGRLLRESIGYTSRRYQLIMRKLKEDCACEKLYAGKSTKYRYAESVVIDYTSKIIKSMTKERTDESV